MTVTPTARGSFLAGIGLWLMLWAAVFKLDDITQPMHLSRVLNKEQCLDWISHHKSTALLGTELFNYTVHGISRPDGVVFALGGTITNALMIFLLLPLRRLLGKRL